MAHPDLINTCLGIHCSVLTVSAAAAFRLIDRSDIVKKSLDGSSATLEQMRRIFARQLGEHLAPVFRERAVIYLPSGLIAPESVQQVRSEPPLPVGSEMYREQIFSFVQTNRDIVPDYYCLYRARLLWNTWLRLLCWAVFMLSFFEFSAVVILLLDKLKIADISNALVHGFGILTVMLGLLIALSTTSILVNHDHIMHCTNKYNPA